jgi:hypothetical protein
MAGGDGAGDHLRRLGDVETARRLHTPQGDVGEVAVVRDRGSADRRCASQASVHAVTPRRRHGAAGTA